MNDGVAGSSLVTVTVQSVVGFTTVGLALVEVPLAGSSLVMVILQDVVDSAMVGLTLVGTELDPIPELAADMLVVDEVTAELSATDVAGMLDDAELAPGTTLDVEAEEEPGIEAALELGAGSEPELPLTMKSWHEE